MKSIRSVGDVMKNQADECKRPLFVRGWGEMASSLGLSINGLKALVKKGAFPAPARPGYRTVLWDARLPEQWRDQFLKNNQSEERNV